MVALEVLRSGGNAVDAAVAAAALLGVVDLHSTGIGGDSFAILWSARDKRLYGINGSGYAPQNLTAEWLLDQGLDRIDGDSVHSVSVPGALRTWEMLLARHGTKSLGEMLEPAIEAARDGFAVAERIAWDWAVFGHRLLPHEASRAAFLIDGQPPRTGTRLKLPRLAETMAVVAREGADAFYEGPLAAAMVETLAGLGGRHTLADFAEWHPAYVEPVKISYRGVDSYQIPPNGQGITAAMMLNILSGFDHSGLDPLGPDRFHLQIEAYRLAAAARDAFLADPAQVEVPVTELISERYAEKMRDRIDLRHAIPDRVVEPIGPTDTVYLTTADAEGNMCSLISSISAAFGSAITCGRTGVLFQNRAANFRVQPGHPNNVAPRKRPLHTIIPGFAMRGGAPWLSYGVMHGFYQPIGQVQVLQNLVDFGMDVQEAIDAPRGMRTATAFEAERGIPASTLRDLIGRGHAVSMAHLPWGGAQAILAQEGVLHAGSDPRKDGLALAW
jgi:gamma-glutamyltranspeptidase/glutathione hydrolase